MNETADKAEEKILESITKSQNATAPESTPKAPATRKRAATATKKNKNQSETKAESKIESNIDSNDADSVNYETRNQFVGRLRWPD